MMNKLIIRIISFLYRGKITGLNNVKIKGRPLFVIKGKLSLGKGILFRSGQIANMTGFNNRMCIYAGPNAELKIDDNSGMSNIVINCVNSISIGKNVMIGTDVKIYDHDFHSVDYKKRNARPEHLPTPKPVSIGDNVFIGTGTIILKGTNIGPGSVIGAGSVVAGDIPANELWMGNPAVFIKKID